MKMRKNPEGAHYDYKNNQYKLIAYWLTENTIMRSANSLIN